MLTWKIFVIVMSVTSLTLVNVNSSGSATYHGGQGPSDEPSSSASRRPKTIQSKEDYILSEIILTDPDQPTFTQQHFPIFYNTFNPLRNTTLGSVCYRQIRTFCDTIPNNSQSNDCLMKAFLYYKSNARFTRDYNNYEDLISHVRYFFANFPLNTENVPLPISFCVQKAKDTIPNELGPGHYDLNQNLQTIEYTESAVKEMRKYVDKCLKNLRDYQAHVPTPEYMAELGRAQLESAENDARRALAKYALNSKTILGMLVERIIIKDNADYQILRVLGHQPINLQLHYLYAIATAVTSSSPEHNPEVYCTAVQAEQDDIESQAQAQAQVQSQAQDQGQSRDQRKGHARFR